jgi:mono/diheme cytochrome c family protein
MNCSIKIVLFSFAVLVSGSVYGRDSKEIKAKRAGEFWSLIVNLDILNSRLLDNEILPEDAVPRFNLASVNFYNIKARFKNSQDLEKIFENLEESLLQKKNHAETAKIISDFKELLFSQLIDLPKPTETPNLELAAATFKKHCSQCHGNSGRSDGSLTPRLKHKPPSLQSSWRTTDLPPIGVYAAVFNGVPDSEMSSYEDILTSHEKWSLAFYTVALRYLDSTLSENIETSDGAASCPQVGDLESLALNSDDSLILKNQVSEDCREAFLVHARTFAPFNIETIRAESDHASGGSSIFRRKVSIFSVCAVIVFLFFGMVLLRRR